MNVQVSTWDAALEVTVDKRRAVRLGLSIISGLPQDAGLRIEEDRAVCPFTTIYGLALRAELHRPKLEKLAAANALASLAGNRREAMWYAVAGAPNKGLPRSASVPEEDVRFAATAKGQVHRLVAKRLVDLSHLLGTLEASSRDFC